VCGRAEISVDEVAIKAEILQSQLQRGDVVTGHGRSDLIYERAGPELVRSIAQGAVGGRGHDPVDEQGAVLLEGPDDEIEMLVEVRFMLIPRCTADRNGGVDCGLTLQHTQAGEYRADLGHRSAARTEAEWLHSEGPFHGTCSSGGPLRRPEITIRT